VFVGHSLGGLYARRYMSRFPGDAAGLVLVDSADERQLIGIIAPGVPPQLWRPGTMSDAELQQFFRRLGEQMAALNPASARDSAKAAPDEAASGEIRMARFYREIAAGRRDFMLGEKPLIVLTAMQTAPMLRFSDD
jgi:pimeloyl-ACP methyl ester carboxylesterase